MSQEGLPSNVVGVMGAANGVEVELFEQKNILQHAFFGDRLSSPLIMFMPADSFNQYRLVVMQQVVVLDLVSLEANLALQIPDVRDKIFASLMSKRQLQYCTLLWQRNPPRATMRP